MKAINIGQERLYNQSLSQKRFTQPTEVVAWLGAVQAQDYAAAKWALGIRLKNSTDTEVEKAFNRGDILRTHVMRPTWHFVMPEDIRWLLKLTAPRVKSVLASYDRKLELTEKELSLCSDTIAKALRGGNQLTRKELAEHLERNSIVARGQRLGHIVIHSELDGLICSGARRKKQFTYALLDERVPKIRSIQRDEALAKLALRYFTSHGPAQLKDFAWWSGLTSKDAKEALNSVKPKLIEKTFEDKTYWFSSAEHFQLKSPSTFLLSIYDEYTIAYKDRSALGGNRYLEKLLGMGNALTAVVIMDGEIVGTWKRITNKDSVTINASPLRKLSNPEEESVKKAASLYGEFLGLPVHLVWKVL